MPGISSQIAIVAELRLEGRLMPWSPWCAERLTTGSATITVQKFSTM